jgi:hypothetical protein
VNVLDENVPESQRQLLRSTRIAVRQNGLDIGRKGLKDQEVLTLRHHLDRPTLFTLDGDFYNRRFCHKGYCLVYLDVEEDAVAGYVRRVLRHPDLNSKGKRMGRIIRASATNLDCWRIREGRERKLGW